jgi:isopropanol dehydrogenase (NADP+)
MKAFIMKALGQVGFMEKPILNPGPNDAVVKTTKALICTSDSHTVGGAIGPRENLTLGHETTHTFSFNEKERAFEIMDKKLDGVLKPLIVF